MTEKEFQECLEFARTNRVDLAHVLAVRHPEVDLKRIRRRFLASGISANKAVIALNTFAVVWNKTAASLKRLEKL